MNTHTIIQMLKERGMHSHAKGYTKLGGDLPLIFAFIKKQIINQVQRPTEKLSSFICIDTCRVNYRY